MAAEKKYTDTAKYENKLKNVMQRFGATDYDFDYSRHAAFVEFRIKGQLYRFEHSVEKAREHGQKINYGSDVFSQIVMALEDLARMTERGIYELQTWIVGMKALPPKKNVPECLTILGFSGSSSEVSVDQIRDRFRALAKAVHPDKGGLDEEFGRIRQAYDEAIIWAEETI